MGREPRTTFTALMVGDEEGFQLSPIDENRLQQLVGFVVYNQETLLAVVLQRIDANHRHHQSSGSRGKTNAAFHRRPSHSDGSSVPAGQAPQGHEHIDQIVACGQRRQRAHVYGPAIGHTRTARNPLGVDAVLRRWLARDSGELLKVFQPLQNQVEYHIRSISAIKLAASGGGFAVKVA